MIDEFELLRTMIKDLELYTTPDSAKRILSYLTGWNNTRPLPPAGDK